MGSAMRFGLEDQCYRALLKVVERVEPLAVFADAAQSTGEPGKGASETALSRLHESLSEFNALSNGMTIAHAARTAIAHGWPQHTPQQVTDNYRKSPERRAKAPPIGSAISGYLSPEARDEMKRSGYQFDHALRQGAPIGPGFCRSPEDDIASYALSLNRLVVEGGWPDTNPLWQDPSRMRPPPYDVTLTELGECVAKHPQALRAPGGAPITVPPHVMLAIMATDNYVKVREPNLANLREVFIMVPLDCPTDVRDREVQRIVNEWRERRQAAGGEIPVRDTLARRRDNMQRLARRVRVLLGAQGGGRQLPHTAQGMAASGNTGLAAFVQSLHEALSADGHHMSISDLEDAVETALQAMQRDSAGRPDPEPEISNG